MRLIIKAATSIATLTLATAALADSEVDRLREALRSTTIQVRSLEDQQAALQAKNAQLDRDNGALKSQVDAAKAEVRKVKKDYKEAVTEFNERLEERNQTLEKWKEAYTEAATVARTKDAERAKFEAESNNWKASTSACTDKNKELVTINRDLLAQYRNVTLGDALLVREPFTGIKRTQVKGVLEDYDERIDAQHVVDQSAKR